MVYGKLENIKKGGMIMTLNKAYEMGVNAGQRLAKAKQSNNLEKVKLTLRDVFKEYQKIREAMEEKNDLY